MRCAQCHTEPAEVHTEENTFKIILDVNNRESKTFTFATQKDK
jgi:hypothetical protein